MLRLRTLELHDYGPYKGTQRIKFSDAPGVVVVYGENGHGKTLLLNAIRYAFFGYVLGRGSRRHSDDSLYRIANREAAAERGHPEFKVVLDFTVDGDEYRLTRTYGPVPAGSSTLRPQMLLRKNGSNLNQEEAQRELVRILPEQIARFFLFDGELLGQYEELLHSDSDEGERIKEAIERILGIPVLTSAKTDVEALAGEVTKQLARAARRNQQTEELGLHLEQAQEKKERLTAECETLKQQIEELEAEHEEADAALSGTERDQRLIAKRDALKQRRDNARLALEDSRAALRQASASAWQAAVAPALERLIPGLDEEVERRHSQYAELLIDKRFRELLREGVESGTCPTCEQGISHDHANAILDRRGPVDDSLFDVVERELRRLRNRRDTLQALATDDVVKELDEKLREHEDLTVEVAEYKAEIDELEEQLAGVKDVDLRDRAKHLANLGKLIDHARNERAQKVLERNEASVAVRALERKLAAQSQGQDGKLEKRAEWLRALSELFDEAIDDYRDSRRREVEREATALFRKMSHQPEYERLTINDQYGLSIVHRSGEEESWRSAGFEHVVALSLLGGLQRCAPVRGPIIMDSPFGRLDDEHVQRVVAALPEMSEQVVLLVYKGELDQSLSADTLGPALLAEKELVQRSSHHTEIVDRQVDV